jgi:hypothetical protein
MLASVSSLALFRAGSGPYPTLSKTLNPAVIALLEEEAVFLNGYA